MAKKQTGSNGNSNGKKGGNGAGSTKVGSFAAAGIAAREVARNEERRVDQQRQAQKATGQFFREKNDGRETDVFMIEGGQIGQYAIPGGDKPSVHLRVQMHKPAAQEAVARPVIYFEAAHEGSGLPGNLSKDTFIKVRDLKLDEYFPNAPTAYGVETQVALYRFLTEQIDQKREAEAKAVGEQLIANMFAESDKDLRGIKREELGRYGLEKNGGIAIFQVFQGKAVSVSVLQSTIPGLVASQAFVPVYLFGFAELKAVTPPAIFEKQKAIFDLLKPILESLSDDEQVEAPKATLRIVPSPATLPPTQTNRSKVEGSTEIKAIMKGAVGVANFVAGGQSAKIKVYDKQTGRGLQRLFEVIEMSGFSESAMLSFETGTTVTAQQLIAGKLEKSEAAGLPSKSASAKLALIAHIEKSIKATRFCKKPSEAILPKAPELKQVA